MRRAIVIIGCVLITLIIAGLCFQLALAVRLHQPFYGTNYKGLALSTYGTILTLGIAGLTGVIRVIQIALQKFRRRHGRAPQP